MYSQWGEYLDCSVSCGEGTRSRERTCIGGICARATPQDLIEISNCNEGSCKFYQARLLIVDIWVNTLFDI